MDNKQISDKLLEMAKFYQMTDEERDVIGKVVEMVRSADDDLISRKAVLELSKWDSRKDWEALFMLLMLSGCHPSLHSRRLEGG